MAQANVKTQASDVESKKSARKISPLRVQLAEHARHDWVVNAEDETTIEELLDPAFWSHIAKDLTPFDHIEVRAEDCTWLAELVVVQKDRTWAIVHLLHKYDLVKSTVPIPAGNFEIKFNPHYKWRVIRKSDGKMLQSGFNTRDEGALWLANHLKSLEI